MGKPSLVDHDEATDAWIAGDPEIPKELMRQAIEDFSLGRYDDTRAALHLLIRATIGYRPLAEKIGVGEKSLRRMLNAKTDPSSRNLSAIFAVLNGVDLTTIDTYPDEDEDTIAA